MRGSEDSQSGFSSATLPYSRIPQPRLRSDVYITPRTPLSVDRSAQPPSRKSTGSLLESARNSNGKRVRAGSETNTPRQRSPEPDLDPLMWSAANSGSSSLIRSTDLAGTDSLVNTTYNLQYGVETTGGLQNSRLGLGDLNDSREGDFRRRWTSTRSTSMATQDLDQSTSFSVHAGGMRRRISGVLSAPPTPGWGSFVFNIVGDVAGKMWDFCNTRVFSGFQAGGGIRYGTTTSTGLGHETSDSVADSNCWEDMPPAIHQSSPQLRSLSPMPGMWPELDYSHVQTDDACESPSRRPSKRQQTKQGQGWVVVDIASTHRQRSPSIRAASPRRGLTNGTGSNQGGLRPVSRATPRLSLHSRYRRSISIATPGGETWSEKPHHRRTGSDIMTRRDQIQSPQHTRKPSMMDPASPLSVEAQRYANRIKREEKNHDASIRRLNERLAAMIQEGKEALETKVEIVDEGGMEDEGFVEGVF